MNQTDFSNIMNQINKMKENGEIPENIAEIINNFNKNCDSKANSFTSNPDNQENFSSSEEKNSNNAFNIDFDTFLKFQNILNSLNNQQNDPRENLLKSLKPYLKDSRQQKIEQYISLLKMIKVIELMNQAGGETK